MLNTDWEPEEQTKLRCAFALIYFLPNYPQFSFVFFFNIRLILSFFVFILFYFFTSQAHPWFKDIVWDKLYEMEAAFKPEVNGELDTQNFMKFDEVMPKPIPSLHYLWCFFYCYIIISIVTTTMVTTLKLRVVLVLLLFFFCLPLDKI